MVPCEFSTSPRTLCGNRVRRIALVRIFKVAGEPSAGIMCVESLSLWHPANFQRRRRTLCGDHVRRIALVVASCEFSTSPANPLRGSCVSNCSRRGAVRILDADCKPSGCFRRVPALARGASCELAKLTTFLWLSAVDGAGACSVLGILFVIDDLLVVCGGWRRWGVERP